MVFGADINGLFELWGFSDFSHLGPSSGQNFIFLFICLFILGMNMPQRAISMAVDS